MCGKKKREEKRGWWRVVDGEGILKSELFVDGLETLHCNTSKY